MDTTSNEAIQVVPEALFTGIDASINYTIYTRKTKPGKPTANPTFECAKSSKKMVFKIVGKSGLSFGITKLKILSELAKTKPHAATLLRNSDAGKGDLGSLIWYAYIAGTQTYPKTRKNLMKITSNIEWSQWIDVCHVSQDKICGLNLMMSNPANELKRKCQEEALLIAANKINRRHNCHVQNRAKRNLDLGLTPDELALDDDEHSTNNNHSTDQSLTSDSSITNFLKQIIGSIAQPLSNAAKTISESVPEAPMLAYLAFCKIADLNGSIERRLTDAGLDQFTDFNQEFLPREELAKLDLRPGVITWLYMNVKSFQNKLTENQMQQQQHIL
ncbi:hypothetical protein DFH28DRAFT_935869 [Melampsora americana]|nr:hypothetical protein DFH28DRAFT_935869 [Melampsora americana]